jgi:hypothetical protein
MFGTSPHFLTAVAGYWLSRLYRAPFVFEIRDLWPKSIVAVGAMSANSPAAKLPEQSELFLYRNATHLVVVTASFVDEIAQRGIDRKKIGIGPGIHTTVDGESRGIIDRAGAGVYSPPEDLEAFVETLRGLSKNHQNLEDMGWNGRRYAEANYSRPALDARYANLLGHLLSRC